MLPAAGTVVSCGHPLRPLRPRAVFGSKDLRPLVGHAGKLSNNTSSCVACRAAADTQAPSVPQSREDAVKQASEAIKVYARPPAASRKKSKKGFSKQSNTTLLSIELPVLDDKPASQVQLVTELLKALAPQSPSTVFFSSADAAQQATSRLKGVRCVHLGSQIGGLDLSGSILVVAPSAPDVPAVSQIASSALLSPFVLCLNPAWTPANLTVQQKLFTDSFETVYCFQPMAVQILLSTREGAVLRRVQAGGPRDPPWQVMMKLDGRDTVVFTKPTRPSATDLEVVFYNTAAATSSWTRGIRAARSFVDNLRQPK